MSGVGKGATTSSIGAVLQAKGFKVTSVKIDPYINVDAGTMNPTEHGEVFVTIDGDETDQDIGNYERFLNTNITSVNYMTTGRVYTSVIDRERSMGYKGKCVQVVPDVPNEVIGRIENAGRNAKADVVMIEIGGTVGEYENILFLEAARMMRLRHPKDVLSVLVSYLPIPSSVGEMKTKPTQHAVRTLNGTGIQPDLIVCRSSRSVDDVRKQKIGIYCNVAAEDVISAPDIQTIYEIPLMFDEQKVGERIMKKLGMRARKNDLKPWRDLVHTIKHTKREIKIAVVGKYFATGDYMFSDSYISVIEAIKHGAWAHNVKPILTWLSSEEYEKNPRKLRELSSYDGIVVPGGFGSRGIEGNISAIKYAREHKIPYFGLCYGLQMAVIEFARNKCGIKKAHTLEVDPKTPEPVVHFMDGQQEKITGGKYGGTMRLGSYECKLASGSIARKAYGSEMVSERHRHRYEVNNDYRSVLEKNGLVLSGVNPELDLVEIIELPRDTHPFFVGVQFHPEFQSRPLQPHPLFKDFVGACLNKNF